MSLFTVQKKRWMPINSICLKTSKHSSAKSITGQSLSAEWTRIVWTKIAGMNFAEFVAVLSGNTDLLDKTKLDSKIMQLEKEQGNFNKEHYRAEKTIAKYEEDIESGKLFIARVTKDIAYVEHFKGERHTTLIGPANSIRRRNRKSLAPDFKKLPKRRFKTHWLLHGAETLHQKRVSLDWRF